MIDEQIIRFAREVKARHATHERPVAGCDWCIAEEIEEEERARRRRLLIEWNAFVNGRETTEAELRSLDGDR